MTGDPADMLARLRALLPLRWFPDTSATVSSLLAGLSDGWSWLYQMLAYARLQTRIATASDSFLDLVSRDFFAANLMRRFGETDAAFRVRILRELLRPRATRPALIGELTALTGRVPVVFEPSRPADTGAYGEAGGYCVTGGYGSLALPFQCFVTAYRPLGSGVKLVGGWGSPAGAWGGGALQYASLAMVESQITDADINAAIANTMPAATIGWTRISN